MTLILVVAAARTQNCHGLQALAARFQPWRPTRSRAAAPGGPVQAVGPLAQDEKKAVSSAIVSAGCS
ncbi:hypothetical protein, partial [Klebsiella michiganensis]|uniref:hypothetical protein n=1 Tax=Klebsiella michiganensis TaxID=1134687 RepID=UPI001952DE39